ncbi:hypothetical protein NCAS_0B08550 [Naumovozyma castellii]|uniref:Uncharacterized protein n=1 Tax=Naumovozyma castellii TaxID=27288 RepID=G0VAR3_NAUCA|nr:hypothetical protein NCAS_0B08550 [Naumovozyma castellii CBS 4309]CCC68939.1 hypothetical protein NCAS_0B08550 [Naumovozyma castellii CBS 4309]
MEDCTIELTDAPTTYTASFVPLKIRYNGPTTEFVNNFKDNKTPTKDDEINNYSTDTTNTTHTTFIRGRCLHGTPVNKYFESASAHVIGKSKQTDNDIENQTYTVQSTVNSIINYEREGNTQRLTEELAHLKEFVQLQNHIHS